ncbi:PAS domain-containing sensor histidine kinase [uncultured Methanofollis sp.]|uniref:sensor histidine kinase n=1 Tax=uncultured Methanofollis sp. TaxID=262500 RepID=UPI0026100AB2|nr:PAS domain-containing sensor histidine kinase [uncultured Methanofollis sp.]
MISPWDLKHWIYLIGINGPLFGLLFLIILYSFMHTAGVAISYLYYIPLVIVATWCSNRSIWTAAALSSGYTAVTLFLMFSDYAVDPVILFLFTMLYLWGMTAVTFFGTVSSGRFPYSVLREGSTFFFDAKSLRITRADPALAEILGLPAHEIQGMPLASVWEDHADMKAFCAVLEKGGTVLHCETYFHGPAGRQVPVLLSCVPGIPEHKCTVLDVTSLKAFRDVRSVRDDAVRKCAAEAERRQDFISTAAHELRTPLQPVFGYLYLLLEDRQKYGLGEEVCRILRICIENINRERNAVNRMLELSLLEEGKVRCDRDPVDLAGIVGEVLACHDFGRDVSISLRIPEHTVISVDHDQFFIVLESLITNAVQYSRNPKVVEISYAEAEAARYVMVKDNGVGIDPGKIGAIFEPFYLADGKRTTRTFNRMGLGLSIAEKYAHLNGGEIRVESVPGRGSTFTVVLWQGEGHEA